MAPTALMLAPGVPSSHLAQPLLLAKPATRSSTELIQMQYRLPPGGMRPPPREYGPPRGFAGGMDGGSAAIAAAVGMALCFAAVSGPFILVFLAAISLFPAFSFASSGADWLRSDWQQDGYRSAGYRPRRGYYGNEREFRRGRRGYPEPMRPISWREEGPWY